MINVNGRSVRARMSRPARAATTIAAYQSRCQLPSRNRLSPSAARPARNRVQPIAQHYDASARASASSSANATPTAIRAQTVPRQERDHDAGHSVRRPNDARVLDERACHGEEHRDDGIGRVPADGPAPNGERGQRVVRGHRQVGVAGQRDVHVGERQRRDEQRADERASALRSERAQAAVDRERERDRRSATTASSSARRPSGRARQSPHLQQRHRRRIFGRRVEIDARRWRRTMVAARANGTM